MSKAIVGAVEIGAAVGLAAATGGAGGILAMAELKGGGFLANLAVSALISGVSTEAGAIADALVQNRGMGITTRQPAAFRQIIYGTQRVGGIIVYCSTTGSAHDQYNFVIVLATHECDAIQNLYLDGRRVAWDAGSAGQAVSSRNGYTFGGSAADQDLIGPNGQHYNFGSLVYCEARFGDQAAGDVIAGLTANDPNWVETSQGSPWLGGCCYVYLKVEFDANMFPSLPEIRFTVNGKNNIFDPRTGTSGFSTNWALIAADVITDPTWGLGSDTVNQAQLIAAANVCDEQVTLAAGGTESRLACHWHYDTSTSPGDVLNTLMTTNEGRISRVGGEWFIYPPYWTGVTSSFDENALLGPISWMPKRSVSDLVNRVTGTYIAPNYPYNVAGNLYDENGWYEGTIQDNWPFAFQPTNYPDFACDQLHGYGTGVDVYLTQDGGIEHPKDLVQSTCLSIAQAQRTAAVSLFRNRQQGSGTLIMNMSAWQMEPGDIMEFSFAPLSWTNKYLEVTQLTLKSAKDQNGNPYQYVEVAVQEADPSVYDWETSLELNAYDVETAPPATPYTVDAPTGLAIEDDTTTQLVLQDGTVMPRVLVTWTPPNDTYVANGGSIQVQYSLATSSGKPMPEVLNPVLNPTTGTYSTGWLDAGSYPGIATTCFIDSINAQQYQTITVQVRAVRSNGASSEWVEVNDHGLNTSTPSFPIGGDGPTFTFAGTGETLDVLEPVASVSAAVVLGATGTQTNLIPDSDLKFGATYWSSSAKLPIVNAAGATGGNAYVFTGTGAASGYQFNRSAVIPVIPNTTYTLSGYTDATGVTSGAPTWGVFDPTVTTQYGGSAAQTAGTSGRVSSTIAIPAGVTSVRVICDTQNATVTSGGKIIFSSPQFEIGSVMTAYKSNSADDTTGSFLYGAMSTEVQSAIQVSTGHVLNLGGIAAGSITPISALMPAEAGADVTSQNIARDTSAVSGVASATVSQGASGINYNLVPDSAMKLGSSYWSYPTSIFAVQAGSPFSDGVINPAGGNNFILKNFSSGTYQWAKSAVFQLIAGQTYTLSAWMYSPGVTAGGIQWVIATPNAATVYASVSGAPGGHGRYSATFTFSPSGVTVGAGVNVVLLCDTAGSSTISGYSYVAMTGSPMVQLGSVATAYLANVLDDMNGYINQPTSQGLVSQGSVVNVSEGSDGSILSYTSNNTSIVMSWASFYIFAPDGNTFTVPAGTQTFSPLSPNIKYYFSCWYNLASNALVVQSTGTVPSTQQFQVQTVQGDGNVGVCIDFTCSTTGSSSQSGGTGVGGSSGGTSCFAPNTLVLVQRDGKELSLPIAEVGSGDFVRTLTGAWRRVFYCSTRKWNGPMQIIPDVGLSTPSHQMWDGDKWVNASLLYRGEIQYEGTVHNLHIDTQADEEHSYTLANGQVVHNLFTNPA